MNNNFKEQANISIDGHVLIKDVDTQEVLLDKHNQINFQNFAFAMASLLANKTVSDDQFFIDKIAFGNGGTVLEASGQISYKNPKIDGINGGLYSALEESAGVPYTKQVSATTVVDAEGNPYTDVVVQVILDYNEPTNAPTLDTAVTDTAADWVIDELALVTESGTYLTHLIFHPIQKSKNRKIEILYSLRIRAGV